MKKIKLDKNLLSLKRDKISSLEQQNLMGGIVFTDAQSGEHVPCQGFTTNGNNWNNDVCFQNGDVTAGINDCLCIVDDNVFGDFQNAVLAEDMNALNQFIGQGLVQFQVV